MPKSNCKDSTPPISSSISLHEEQVNTYINKSSSIFDEECQTANFIELQGFDAFSTNDSFIFFLFIYLFFSFNGNHFLIDREF